MVSKRKLWSVEWVTDNGDNIGYEEFATYKQALAYYEKHKNDKDKEDIHIQRWKYSETLNGDPIWEAI